MAAGRVKQIASVIKSDIDIEIPEYLNFAKEEKAIIDRPTVVVKPLPAMASKTLFQLVAMCCFQ
jgi:hypothetical protein